MTRPFTIGMLRIQNNMASSMPWSSHWTELTPYFGFCNDLNEVFNIKKAFEVFSSITYVSGKQEKDFGKNRSKFISICIVDSKILLICLYKCSVYMLSRFFLLYSLQITFKAHSGPQQTLIH